jgi:predicted porin
MNKSLLALAVFGAFAGAASAQTSVTVYGVADLGLVREYGSLGPGISKLDSGIQSGSRLGFKGTEDLGSGLKALFQLETGIAMDAGNFTQKNTAFGRQSWVGLGGNFGMVSLGRQYQSTFTALDEVDPFGSGLAGNSGNLFTSAARNNNMIRYAAPEMGGFTGELEYGFGEQAGNTHAARTLGGSFGYGNGPALVKLSYERENNPLDTGTARFTQLTGSYDFSVVKLALAYRKDRSDATAVDVNADNYLIGVTAPFGANAVMASYMRHKDKSNPVAGPQDANQVAVGYTYALSKRTNFYSSYARINNSNGAAFVVGNAVNGGSNDKAFNVGVRHKF